MSLTKQQEEQIAYEISVNHRSYKCVAAKLGVPISEVRRIGAPIVAERLNNYKELNKIVKDAKYNRRPYYREPVANDKPSKMVGIISLILIICIVVIIVAATAGLVKLFLGF